jgi:hypothetical protein
MQADPSLYSALAIFVLLLHALFILWIVFGAILIRSRPVLRWLHITSLVWGVLTELLPWPWSPDNLCSVFLWMADVQSGFQLLHPANRMRSQNQFQVVQQVVNEYCL